MNSSSTLKPYRLLVVILFLLPHVEGLYAQCETCPPASNSTGDAWSRECYLKNDCTEQGNPCTANDVNLIGSFIADLDGGPVPTCMPGDEVTVALWGQFLNGTNTNRYAVRAQTDVLIDGVCDTTLNACAFDNLPPGDTTLALLGTITYICGEPLQLRNTWVAWETTSNATCASNDLCGEYQSSKCSKNIGLIDFLSPNFDFSCGELTDDSTEVCFMNLTTGGDGLLTYSWDFGDGNTSMLENPCHTYANIDGPTFTVTLTVIDTIIGTDTVQAGAFLEIDLNNLGCCTLDVVCPVEYPTPVECIDDIPAATEDSITILDMCGMVVITIDDVTTGTGCMEDTMYVTRTYIIDDMIYMDTCVQVFRAVDDEAPTMLCPADTILTCGQSTDPSNTGMPTGISDNCSSMLGATYNDVTTGSCPTTITRTWTVVDDCGNEFSCDQIITIDDVLDPVLTCPGNLVLECGIDDYVAEITAHLALVTVTDNCDDNVDISDNWNGTDVPTLSCTQSSGLPITVTATDSCGNTDECVITIYIDDTTAPVLTCPADLTLECVDGTDYAAMIETHILTASATDACDGTVVISDDYDGTSIPTLSCDLTSGLTILLTATDDCGNIDTCSITVYLDDNAEPTITCVDDLTLECVEGADYAAAIETHILGASATDACDTDVEITDNYDGTSTPALSCDLTDGLTIILTATDDCGNIDTCSFMVYLDDITPPVITCPADLTLECVEGSDYVALIEAHILTASATDACDDAVDITDNYDGVSVPVLSCDLTDGLTIILTATDDCGNIDTCSFTVYLDDTVDPTITCPADLTLECVEGTSYVSAILTYIETASATDACDDAVDITDDYDALTVPDLSCDLTDGLTILLTATDDCGNTDTCSFLVYLNDTQAPEIDCPIDAMYMCMSEVPAPTADDATATDACDTDVAVTFVGEEISAGVCPKILVRTYRATDDCGNIAECTQTITINDTTPPDIDCPAAISYQCMADVPAPSATDASATDNCGNATVTFVGQTVSTSICPRTIVRTYKATDDCGNMAFCTQTITVDDTMPPTTTCPQGGFLGCNPDPVLYAPDDAPVWMDNCGILASGVIPDIFLGGTECIIDVVNGTNYAALVTYQHQYWAVDSCFNSDTCFQTFSWWIDNDPPSADPQCPAGGDLGCNPDPVEYAANDNPAWVDCLGVLDSDVIPGTPTNTMGCTWTVTNKYWAIDNCNNSDTCYQTFTWIVDIDPPSLTCPDDLTVQCMDEVPPIDPGDVIAADNCSEVFVTLLRQVAIGPCAYVFLRTYIAEDDCGNTATCLQTIVVDDTTPPSITCPSDATYECLSDVPPPVDPTSLTATDNCGQVTVTYLGETRTASNCPRILVRTYKATDGCMNMTICTQTITVNDTTPPTITCPPDRTFEWPVGFNMNPVLPNVPQDPSIDPQITGFPIINDNCGILGTIYTDQLFGPFPNTCPILWYVQRLWTTTDTCYITATCVQFIYFTDFTPPEIICPPAATYQCFEDVPPPADPTTLTATDNCGTPTVTFVGETMSTGNCPKTLVRKYKATDNCMNMTTCTQRITIHDTVPPSITCPADRTFEWPAGFNMGPVGQNVPQDPSVDPAITGYPTGSDNCEIIDTLFQDNLQGPLPLNCPNLWVLYRTWTYVDACLNTASCVQRITFTDFTPPTITCPDAVTVECIDDVPPPADPSTLIATDNCGTPTVTYVGQTVSDAHCPTIIIRTYKATDNCMNMTFCTQTITVDDTTPPSITCPNHVTIECDQPIPTTCPMVTDNCSQNELVATVAGAIDAGDPVMHAGFFNWGCFETGQSCDKYYETYTLTVTDGATYTFTGVFNGGFTGDGMGGLFAGTFDPNNPCDNFVAGSDDDNPNSVLDPQIIVCALVPGEYTLVSTTFHCGDVMDYSWTIEHSDIELSYMDSDPVGSCPMVITRTHYAMDVCGNVASCTQYITIDDTVPPSLTCPDNVTIEWPEANSLAESFALAVEQCDIWFAGFIATDNCSQNLITNVDSDVTFLCPTDGQQDFAPFVKTVYYSVVDDCGNESSCTRTFTVEDTTPPTISCPADITVECAQNGVSGCVMPDNGTGTVDLPPTCPYLGNMAIIDGLPPGTTIEIQVELGNFTNVVVTPGGSLGGEHITFDATLQLHLVGTGTLNGFVRDITIPVDQAGAAGMDFAPRVAGAPVQSFDADFWRLFGQIGGIGDPDFALLRITAGTDFGLPSPGHTTLTRLGPPGGPYAVDSFFDITFRVDFVGEPGGAVGGMSGSTTGTERFEVGGSGAPDPDPGLVVATDFADPDVFVTWVGDVSDGNSCPETITRTYIAIDDCGNSASCTQHIVIDDTTPPAALTCPESVDLGCNPDELPPPAILTTVDNCSGILTAELIPTIAVLDGCNATLVRYYRATDDCGNSVTCTQHITWTVDITPPSLTCPDGYQAGCNPEGVPAPGQVFVSDNCGDAFGFSFDGHYYVLSAYGTWNDARNEALALGGDLVAINSAAENAFLSGVFGSEFLWIGYTDEVSEGTWVWTNGDPSGYENWYPGEPNDFLGEDYGITNWFSVGGWNDLNGADIYRGIIELTTPIDAFVTVDTLSTDTVGCVGSVTYLYTAQDACDNSSACTQTILYTVDLLPPMLTGCDDVYSNGCPPPVSVLVSIFGSDPLVSATDNCGQAELTFTFDTEETPCRSSVTFYWRAEDDCGNVSSCTQTITIEDKTAPLMTVPDDITIQCGDEETGVAIAADNCSSATVTYVDLQCSQTIEDFTGDYDFANWTPSYSNGGNVLTSGDTMATLISADGGLCIGGISTLLSITVPEDGKLVFAWNYSTNDFGPGYDPFGYNINGTFVPLTNNSGPLTQSGLAAALVSAGDVFSFEQKSTDCIFGAGATTVIDFFVYTCTEDDPENPCNYTIFRCWSATDECGNTAYDLQRIHVEDSMAPIISCPASQTVECGEPTDIEFLGVASATDNCSDNVAITYVDDIAEGLCAQEYTITRTWYAEDECGNIASCTQTISVIDNTAPTVFCPRPGLFALDPFNELAFDIALYDLDQVACTVSVAGDYPGIPVPVIGVRSFGFDIDPTDGQVYLLASPSNQFDRRLYRLDITTGATVEIGQVISVGGSTEPQDISFDGTGTLYAVFGGGELNTVDLLTATTTFVGAVPAGGGVGLTYDFDANRLLYVEGIGSINLYEVTLPGYAVNFLFNYSVFCSQQAIEYVGGNKLISSTTFGCNAIWSVDLSGQSATVIASPTGTFSNIKDLMWIGGTEGFVECGDDLGAPSETGIPLVYDNCGDVSTDYTDSEYISTGNGCNPFYIIRTWTAVDECGNASACTQHIDVFDTTPPDITCPENMTIECDVEPDPMITGTPISTDNCSEVSVTYSDAITEGDCPQEYTITRTWRAADACGNEATCTQLIAVVDTTPPVLTIPADTVVDCHLVGTLSPLYELGIVERVFVNSPQDISGGYLTGLPVFGPQLTEDPITADLQLADDNVLVGSDACSTPLDDLTGKIALIDRGGTPTACFFTDKVYHAQLAGAIAVIIANNDVFNPDAVIGMGAGSFPPITIPSVMVSYNAGVLLKAALLTGAVNVTLQNDPVFTVSDNCDPDPDVTYSDLIVDGNCAGNYTIIRTYTATDACGNATIASQVISVVDTIAPQFVFVPEGGTVECIEDMVFGDAFAFDFCTDVTTTYADMSGNFLSGTLSGGQEVPPNGSPAIGTVSGLYNPSTLMLYIQVTYSGLMGTTTASHIHGPAPAGVNAGVQIPLPITTGVTAGSFNLSTTLTAAQGMDLLNGLWYVNIHTTAFPGGEIRAQLSVDDCDILVKRTWTATDDCENSSTAFSTVLVSDTTPPSITCPDDATVECLDDVPAPVDPGTLTATDNCGEVVVTYVGQTMTDVGICPVIVTRTYKATDACGNMTTCTQTITVQDTQDPTASSVSSSYQCGVQVPPPNPEIITDEMDNCDPNPAVEFLPQNTQNNGGSGCPNDPLIVTRYYSITDDCGNSTIVSHTITVVDDTPPTITCPADIDAECGSVPAPNPDGIVADDNCSLSVFVTWVSDVTVGEGCTYTIVRTYRAEDFCGNSTTCTQHINVEDTTAPAIGGGGQSINCSGTYTVMVVSDGFLDETVWEIRNALDQVVATGGPYFDEFNAATYTASGVAPHVGPFTFHISTVGDFGDNTPSFSVSCNGELVAGSIGGDQEFTSGEFCCESSQEISQNCSGTYTLIIAGSGFLDETVWEIENSSDQVVVSGGPYDPGTINVETYEASGIAPHVGPFTFTISTTGTFDDNVAFYLVSCGSILLSGEISGGQVFTSDPFCCEGGGGCPVGAELGCNPEELPPPAELSAIDACAGIVPVTVEVVQNDTVGCVGTLVYQYTAEDDCGNTTTCTQSYTYQVGGDLEMICTKPAPLFCPEETPTPESIAEWLIEEGYASATGTCTDAVVSWVDFYALDNNCALAWTFGFAAEDACGGTSDTCYIIVQIYHDEIAPVITCSDPPHLGCNPQSIPTAQQLISTGFVSATDNCGPPSLGFIPPYIETVNGCEHARAYRFRATDGCGNQSVICTVTVRWTMDNEAPELACPEDLVLECPEAIPAPQVATATDNCGVELVTFVSEVGSGTFCDSLIVRTYYAVDACGNSTTCTQHIIFRDSTPPSITCPDDLTLECGVDEIPTTLATATDLCDQDLVVTYFDVEYPQECDVEVFVEGEFKVVSVIVRTHHVTDNCGNSASCTQHIIIRDDTPPMLTCPDDITIQCDQDPNDLGLTGVATAVDLCDPEAYATILITFTSYESPCSTVLTRVWEATDQCGNGGSSEICVQLITIVDTEAPQISCPDDVTIECGDPLPMICPSATDNCTEGVEIVESLSGSLDEGDPLMNGAFFNNGCFYPWFQGYRYYDTYNFTVAETGIYVLTGIFGPEQGFNDDDDGMGGVFAGTFDPLNPCENFVAGSDDDRPNSYWDPQIITCLLEAGEYVLVSTSYWGSNPAMDYSWTISLSDITLSHVDSDPVGECPMVITRTHYAEDECGNVSSCTQYIYIEDTTAPSITCPDDVTIECGDPLPTDLATVSDICDADVDVTYVDMTCLSGTWSGTVAGYFVEVTFNSDCSSATVVFDGVPCNPIVTWELLSVSGNVYTYLETDLCGINSCIVTVTDNGSTLAVFYNCVGDGANFTSSNEGCQQFIKRTFFAEDDCGNVSSCQQYIAIVDTTPPSITCPPDATVECGDEVGGAGIATATDICSDAFVTIVGEEVNEGSCTYTIIRTYQAWDECGNTVTCTQVITVEDTTAPEISCPPDMTLACDQSTCLTFDEYVVGQNGPLVHVDQIIQGTLTIDITAWSKGGIQRDPVLYNTSTPHPNDLDLGTPNTLYGGPGINGDDPDGYEASNNRSIGNIVIVQTPGAGYPNDYLLSDSLVFEFSEPVFIESAVVVDFEDLQILTGGGIFLYDVDGALISFTAALGDGADNSMSEVVLHTPGVAKMKLYYGTTIPASGGISSICYTYLPCDTEGVSTFDVCSDVEVICQDTTIDIDGCTTQIIRTYSAVDACDNLNEAACTQTISFLTDGEQPDIICPADITIGCEDEVPAPDPGLVVATDNCSDAANITIEWVGDYIDGLGCAEVIRRVYRATDECGNEALCVQFITREGIPQHVVFVGQVFLQAAMMPDTAMDARLNDMGYLPDDQPYNMPPYNYTGTEQCGDMQPDVVDWVLVQLRDVVTMEVVDQKAALVKENGMVVSSEDCVSPVVFDAVGDWYYLTICHRNHLGIVTDVPMDCSEGWTICDFTHEHGTMEGMVEYFDGVYAMTKGDVNGDNLIKYNGSNNDKNAVLSAVGILTPNNVIPGYNRYDVNMDGVVKYNGSNNDKNAILSVVGLLTPNNVITGPLYE